MRQVLGIAVWLAVATTACTKPNPALCCVSTEDCASVGLKQSEKACASGLACVSHTCVQAPDAGAGQCVSNTDCVAPTPYCGADRTCVQCTASDQCPSTAPVCDSSTQACRTCSADSECASSVCNLFDGTCAAQVSVLYVSPTGGDAASCAQNDPCSIAHAIALLDNAHHTIKLAPGSYSASALITKDALLEGTGATLTATNNLGAIEVADGAHVQVIGLSLVSLQGVAVRCDTTASGASTPTLDLVDVTTDSYNSGLFAYPCFLSVSQSKIHLRATNAAIAALQSSTAIIDRTLVDGGDGIFSGLSVVRITNSVVANQTGPDGAFSGNFMGTAGKLFVSFSTVINSIVKSNDGLPECAGGTGIGVCIDNSVIVNLAPNAPTSTVTGTASLLTYTMVYPQATSVSGSNNQVGVNPQLVDPANGDYHLSAGSPAIDAADPLANDPVDFDGTSRPQGARDDMGAYEHK